MEEIIKSFKERAYKMGWQTYSNKVSNNYEDLIKEMKKEKKKENSEVDPYIYPLG